MEGARRHPRQTALRCKTDDGWQSVSYRQLCRLVRAAGTALARRGLEPGGRVALAAPNCAEWIVAYLAVVGTGAAVVPLDPKLKEEELADQISGCLVPTLVLTSPRLHPTIASIRARTGAAWDLVVLDEGGVADEGAGESAPGPDSSHRPHPAAGGADAPESLRSLIRDGLFLLDRGDDAWDRPPASDVPKSPPSSIRAAPPAGPRAPC